MPTQVYAGSFAINTYTLCIALACLAGGAWTLWQGRQRWKASGQLSGELNSLLLLAFCSLICGRIGYVLLHVVYFQEHPEEIISSASPGYWEHAAIAGGLLAWLVLARTGVPEAQAGPGPGARRWRSRVRLSAVNGVALIMLASLIGIGASVGCVPHGCAYGREVFWTDGWMWSLRVDWPDAYTLNNPRLPTQLLEVAWLTVCLAVVWLNTLRHRTDTGDTRPVMLWLLLFSLGDCAIQFIRADSSPILGPVRAPQWADIALAGWSTIWLLLKQS